MLRPVFRKVRRKIEFVHVHVNHLNNNNNNFISCRDVTDGLQTSRKLGGRGPFGIFAGSSNFRITFFENKLVEHVRCCGMDQFLKILERSPCQKPNLTKVRATNNYNLIFHRQARHIRKQKATCNFPISYLSYPGSTKLYRTELDVFRKRVSTRLKLLGGKKKSRKIEIIRVRTRTDIFFPAYFHRS